MIHFQFELSSVKKMFELLERQEGSKKFAVVGRLFLCVPGNLEISSFERGSG